MGAREVDGVAPLNPKQAQFVQEYLIDLDGAKAAVRAGYSAKTAPQIANRLLSFPRIHHAVKEAMAARSKRVEITQDMVLKELAKIGFSDIRKVVKWGTPRVVEDDEEGLTPMQAVRLVPSEEVDDDTAGAIAEVSDGQYGIKLKMYDKQAALVNIGRHLGMFRDRLEHTGADGQPLGPASLTVVIASDSQDPAPAQQAG